jgi:hypothetical protein
VLFFFSCCSCERRRIELSESVLSPELKYVDMKMPEQLR